MRTGALRAATAKAAAQPGEDADPAIGREKPNRKRMAALVTVYDAEPAQRRPHDVIAPPGGRHGARGLRPGPKALAKWLAGSVRKDPADMIAAAFDEAEARDPGHLRTWVVLVDGAEHQLALIRAEAARRGVTIHVIIDIIHVLEYIWGARAEPARRRGTRRRGLGLRPGPSRSSPATASGPPPKITAEADAASLDGKPVSPGPKRARVRYLGNKRQFCVMTRPWTPAGRSRRE